MGQRGRRQKKEGPRVWGYPGPGERRSGNQGTANMGSSAGVFRGFRAWRPPKSRLVPTGRLGNQPVVQS